MVTLDTNINFETEMRPIQVCGGRKIPDRKAIVRQDTGDVLGIVGKDYVPVPHEAVVDAFKRTDILEYQSAQSVRNGQIMFTKFKLRDNGGVKKADVNVGDVVDFGIRGFNSYNEMFGVGFEIVGEQLICRNGVCVPKTIARLSFKHFRTFDIDRLRSEILNRSNQIMPTVERWRNWTKVKPSEDRIKKFFEYAGVGKRLEKLIYEDCLKESRDRGVWGIYSRFTHYLTHEMKVRNEQNRELSLRGKEHTVLQKFYGFNWN